MGICSSKQSTPKVALDRLPVAMEKKKDSPPDPPVLDLKYHDEITEKPPLLKTRMGNVILKDDSPLEVDNIKDVLPRSIKNIIDEYETPHEVILKDNFPLEYVLPLSVKNVINNYETTQLDNIIEENLPPALIMVSDNEEIDCQIDNVSEITARDIDSLNVTDSHSDDENIVIFTTPTKEYNYLDKDKADLVFIVTMKKIDGRISYE
jgi:hypothetical protein